MQYTPYCLWTQTHTRWTHKTKDKTQHIKVKVRKAELKTHVSLKVQTGTHTHTQIIWHTNAHSSSGHTQVHTHTQCHTHIQPVCESLCTWRQILFSLIYIIVCARRAVHANNKHTDTQNKTHIGTQTCMRGHKQNIKLLWTKQDVWRRLLLFIFRNKTVSWLKN